MWGDAAKMSYSPSNTPDYVKNIQGPMRKYYVKKERAARELLLYNVRVTETHISRTEYVKISTFREDLLSTMHLLKTSLLSMFSLVILMQ